MATQDKKVRSTFYTPFEQYREHNGKRLDIMGVHDDLDEEVGIQYEIVLETGETIMAWPEEVHHE